MHRRGIFLLGTLFFLASVTTSFGQDEDIFGITRKARNPKSDSRFGNIFRNVQEQFSFQLSTGAAYYTLKSEFYKGDGQVYPITQYQNQDYGYFPLTDTLTLTSRQLLLPTVEAGLRLNLFNILTLGGGYGWENSRQAPFEGGGYQFSLQRSAYKASNYYASAGLVLYDASRRRFLLKMKYKKFDGANPELKMRMKREFEQRIRQNYPWTISVEAEVGKVNVNQGEPLVPKVYQADLAALEDQFTYAAALRIGYELSEYASVFAKGKYMQRSFVNNSPDFAAFPMDQEVYSVQVGLAMKIPGTKRCKITGCGVVMKHNHNGVEYRGSSIFTLQNRKIGQWY
ncbi:MAG: hypothetical protein NBV61_03835 [Algoriphagus sp.]|nr:hypothetical protein [Algoriphagus sp.]